MWIAVVAAGVLFASAESSTSFSSPMIQISGEGNGSEQDVYRRSVALSSTMAPSHHSTPSTTSQPSKTPTNHPSVLTTSRQSGTKDQALPTFHPSSNAQNDPAFQSPTVLPSLPPLTKPPTSLPTIHPFESSVSPTNHPTSPLTMHPSESATTNIPTKGSGTILPSTMQPSTSLTLTDRPIPPTVMHPSHQTSLPTMHPTSSTNTPTRLPTSLPSMHPSASNSIHSPTNRPTSTPSTHPSESLTRLPTNHPTSPPTMNPSAAPTMKNHPATSPPSSIHPSASPTEPPTSRPTLMPTIHPPSASPTTTHPSRLPSSPPSTFPSGAASVTNTPTYHSIDSLPSMRPSKTPTNNTQEDLPSLPPLTQQPSPVSLGTTSPTTNAPLANPPTNHPSLSPSVDPSVFFDNGCRMFQTPTSESSHSASGSENGGSDSSRSESHQIASGGDPSTLPPYLSPTCPPFPATESDPQQPRMPTMAPTIEKIADPNLVFRATVHATNDGVNCAASSEFLHVPVGTKVVYCFEFTHHFQNSVVNTVDVYDKFGDWTRFTFDPMKKGGKAEKELARSDALETDVSTFFKATFAIISNGGQPHSAEITSNKVDVFVVDTLRPTPSPISEVEFAFLRSPVFNVTNNGVTKEKNCTWLERNKVKGYFYCHGTENPVRQLCDACSTLPCRDSKKMAKTVQETNGATCGQLRRRKRYLKRYHCLHVDNVAKHCPLTCSPFVPGGDKMGKDLKDHRGAGKFRLYQEVRNKMECSWLNESPERKAANCNRGMAAFMKCLDTCGFCTNSVE